MQNIKFALTMTHKEGFGGEYNTYRDARSALLAKARDISANLPECCPVRIIGDELTTKDKRGWKIVRVAQS
jgi:hypothetical protein